MVSATWSECVGQATQPLSSLDMGRREDSGHWENFERTWKTSEAQCRPLGPLWGHSARTIVATAMHRFLVIGQTNGDVLPLTESERA